VKAAIGVPSLASNAEPNIPEHLRPPSVEMLEKILAPLPMGTVSLHHFDESRTLGKGSFGLVKMVTVKNDSTPFALKCISKWKMTGEWGMVTTAATALIREIEILKRATSPSIVNCFRCFHDNDYAYILLEYVNGGEITRFLNEEEMLSADSIKFLSAEIALAIGELHTRGILFRDFKPANLLLDSGGHIKVVDFGLAKVINDEKTETVCGTLTYQAPELLLNKPYFYPVDWWALPALSSSYRQRSYALAGRIASSYSNVY